MSSDFSSRGLPQPQTGAKTEQSGSKLAVVHAWKPLSATGIGLLLFIGAQLLASIPFFVYPTMRHWSAHRAQTWINGAYAQFVYVFLAEAITMYGLLWFMRRRKMALRSIGWRRFRVIDTAYALSGFGVYFVAYALLLTVAAAIVPHFNANQQQDIGFQQVYGNGQLFVTALSLVVLPPLVEETLFRGFLFTSFRRRYKFLVSTLLTSLLFAAPHLLESQSGSGLLWIGGLDTFTLSLVLCFLREKTGSLWPGVGVHAIKNGIAFVSLFLLHAR